MPFLTPFLVGRVPLLKWTTEKGYPYSILSTGGPRGKPLTSDAGDAGPKERSKTSTNPYLNPVACSCFLLPRFLLLEGVGQTWRYPQQPLNPLESLAFELSAIAIRWGGRVPILCPTSGFLETFGPVSFFCRGSPPSFRRCLALSVGESQNGNAWASNMWRHARPQA